MSNRRYFGVSLSGLALVTLSISAASAQQPTGTTVPKLEAVEPTRPSVVVNPPVVTPQIPYKSMPPVPYKSMPPVPYKSMPSIPYKSMPTGQH